MFVLTRKLSAQNIILAFVVAISSMVFAQGDASQGSTGSMSDRYEAAVTAGAFLPFGIVGVRSSYGGWSGRLGIPLGIFKLDLSAHNFRGEGATIYMLNASVGDYIDFHGLKAHLFFGPTLSHYQGKIVGATEPLDYRTVQGFHVGGAPVLELSSSLLFRADFQLTFSPGFSLYTGIGATVLF